jgi:2-polyprenyl-3-methyl-5-hydroxy-6-metoxy-1,4-benzoquinol methylase
MMCATLPATTIDGSSGTVTDGAAVWDRLWHHRHSDAKDDALLARERRNPRWAAIVERLEATFGSIEGLRTIELGSGRGDLSALLAQHGATVTLLDASEKALAQARDRFTRMGLSAGYECGDMLEALDSSYERFDVALSSGVIEHFKGGDRTRAVRAHFDALRPGGVAVISVPHAWCVPYRIWKLYLELRGWWPYGMEMPYSVPELTRRARAAGFARTETHCSGLWQSVGDHWGRTFLKAAPDWVDRRSLLDGVMGLTLVMFGWRGAPGQGAAGPGG